MFLAILSSLIFGLLFAGSVIGLIYLCIKHWWVGCSLISVAIVLAMLIFI